MSLRTRRMRHSEICYSGITQEAVKYNTNKTNQSKEQSLLCFVTSILVLTGCSLKKWNSLLLGHYP